jgi:hypothetical protein
MILVLMEDRFNNRSNSSVVTIVASLSIEICRDIAVPASGNDGQISDEVRYVVLLVIVIVFICPILSVDTIFHRIRRQDESSHTSRLWDTENRRFSRTVRLTPFVGDA